MGEKEKRNRPGNLSARFFLCPERRKQHAQSAMAVELKKNKKYKKERERGIFMEQNNYFIETEPAREEKEQLEILKGYLQKNKEQGEAEDE